MHEDGATLQAFFKPRTNSDAEAADAIRRAEVIFSYSVLDVNYETLMLGSVTWQLRWLSFQVARNWIHRQTKAIFSSI